MESSNDDYKLIKRSFEDAMFKKYDVETHKIYRVRERHETNEKKSDNMLLFHGTNIDGVVGILDEGFKQSTRGNFGPGVYLSASPSCTVSYSISRTKKLKSNITQLHIFVNEVLESKKLKVVDFKKTTIDARQSHFKKYIVKGTAENDSDDIYENDSDGRKIRTSQATRRDDSNHYVCHETFVIPRYLIEFYSNGR